MLPTLPAKRTLALVLAATAVGTAAAISVPAMASDSPQESKTRSTRAAQVPDMTFDYTGSDTLSGPPALGVPYGNRAKANDVDGHQIGTAYGNCVKDEIGSTQDQVLCSTVLKFTDGAQIAITSVRPTAHPGAELRDFDAIVTGGTLRYEGLTGSARFTPRSVGVYDVSFS
ncbi:hypothetical protein GCM10018790_13810 [Kitasatospora xanthocidica]|uniref:hypothetical protein n=1 Tax=Kitasatospora xanthocidica TaxID=83382 RepID=UPI001679581E|nr:hypothetical protein [Kitasatospora xanthocidica]GHF37414.1 hypothetical protein GCM10018790_13810 [Kitasatospora xanthocidica]